MDISFPHDKPGIYTLNHTVAFPAVLAGKNIICEITEEALQERFAVRPADDLTKGEYDAALVAAFEHHRAQIEAAASRRLSRSESEISCLLTAQDF